MKRSTGYALNTQKKRPVTDSNKNTTKYESSTKSTLYEVKNDEIEGVL